MTTKSLSLSVVIVLAASSAWPAEPSMGPWLLNPSSTGMWVNWESPNTDQESLVEWGLAPDRLLQKASGNSIMSGGGTRIHKVELKDLGPDRKIYYRIKTKNTESGVFSFHTLPSTSGACRFIGISDTQERPDVFKRVIELGILPTNAPSEAGSLSDRATVLLHAGDLAVDGKQYASYLNEFFKPASGITPYLPICAVPGNHDAGTHETGDIGPDAQNFYDLFRVSQGKERFSTCDCSNVSVIMLDTDYPTHRENDQTPGQPEKEFEKTRDGRPETEDEQIDFLAAKLDGFCNDPKRDFLLMLFHKPAQAEMWPPGESRYSAKVISRAEKALAACNKAGAAIFGHSHTYSRGQSRDSEFFLINGATAAGRLESWGECEQTNYATMTTTESTLGHLLIETTAGTNASLTVTRHSVGNDTVQRNDEVQDQVALKKSNTPPDKPAQIELSSQCAAKASPYADKEDSRIMMSAWQVVDAGGNVVEEKFLNSEDIYYGADQMAGVDITRFKVATENLTPGKTYYIRVKYRDTNLAWSKWSAPFLLNAQSCAPASPSGAGHTSNGKKGTRQI